LLLGLGQRYGGLVSLSVLCFPQGPDVFEVVHLSRENKDLVAELGGEPVAGFGEPIERYRDLLQQSLLLGREQDSARSDDPELTPFRDGSSAPFIEQEKTTGASPSQQDGARFTRAEGEAQRLQFLAA